MSMPATNSGTNQTPTLVRVVAGPHARMIICPDHLRQIAEGAVIAHVELDRRDVTFWSYRCLMCGVEASPDRVCENEDCRRPLHPQWPAVYCCNDCAQDDV